LRNLETISYETKANSYELTASVRAILVTILISLFALGACNGGQMAEKSAPFPSIKDVPASSWQKLSEKKIFFGHQSVGNNILDGIKGLMKDNPQIKLNIVQINTPTEFSGPVFAHAWIGQNTKPQSKIEAFTYFLDNGVGNNADIAFFKFCYVDVTARTDVQRLFSAYKNTMSRLKNKFPKIRFIHMTTPLTSKLTGLDAWTRKTKNLVKKIIGRPVFGYHDNIERNQFNEMLRREYADKEPLFDLAKIESTFPDGTRASFTKEGKTFYFLVPAYTHDGGHLNEKGRKIVAEQLLILLTNLAEQAAH